jgi:hypothetical protein
MGPIAFATANPLMKRTSDVGTEIDTEERQKEFIASESRDVEQPHRQNQHQDIHQ